MWKLDPGALTPAHPVTLTWDNGHGLVFTRKIAPLVLNGPPSVTGFAGGRQRGIGRSAVT